MTEYMEARRNETMKKVYMTLIGILAAAAATFAVMWFIEKNDQSAEAREAAAAAQRAADAFAAYAENGSGRDYILAVSEYYSFNLKIGVLTNDTARASYYTDACAMYEILIGKEAYGQAHAGELSAVMKQLAGDIYEPGAYLKLKQLTDAATE